MLWRCPERINEAKEFIVGGAGQGSCDVAGSTATCSHAVIQDRLGVKDVHTDLHDLHKRVSVSFCHWSRHASHHALSCRLAPASWPNSRPSSLGAGLMILGVTYQDMEGHTQPTNTAAIRTAMPTTRTAMPVLGPIKTARCRTRTGNTHISLFLRILHLLRWDQHCTM